MSELESARAAVGEHGLTVAAVAPLTEAERLSNPVLAPLRSVALVSPAPQRFWTVFSASPEYSDGAPDPIDRWSRRIGEALAGRIGATALYPFGGEPYWPFYSWALRSGRMWPSPITLLVNAETGLWTSFRMALGFSTCMESADHHRPCDSCDASPCRRACPVDAFDDGAYHVGRCRAHCATPEGADCAANGCRARRACPVGAVSTPPPAQAALHMSAFLGVAGFEE